MKKISLALVTLAPLLMSGSIQDIHDGDLQSVITNQTTVNTIIASTTQIDAIQAKEDSKIDAAAGGQYVYSSTITILNIPLAYSFTKNIGVDISIPVVSNSNSENTGIGDVALGATYNFGKTSSTTGLNITNLRYKTTTGGDTFDGLGSGADAISLSHTIAKNISGSFQLHGLVNYTLNSENDFGITYGDSYSAMIGESHKCLLTDAVKINTKLVYFHNDGSTFAGGSNADELSTTDFWIEASTTKIIPAVPLSVGVKIPIIYEAGTATTASNDSGESFMFYVSAMSFF